MNLSSPFIKRPVMTCLVMLALAFFGLLSYKALPVSDMPSIDFPTIEVTISYPGADPTTVANNVVTPLEEQFTTIPGIQTISSNSVTGSGTIILQFNLDRPIDAAATDVLSAINAASAQLPKDLPYSPTYTKANPTATPILFFSVSSETMTRGDLYTYAHTVIGERLNILEGISQVHTYGAPYAVRLQVDPQKLAARNIGIDEFGETIRNANVYLPTGTLYGPTNEYTIQCEGQINQAEGYKRLIIKHANGLITRLEDVAVALDSLQNDKYYTQYVDREIQQPMVGLAITQQAGANTLAVIKSVNEKLPGLLSEIPSSIVLSRMYDQSDYITESVEDVEMTLLIALFLVVLVIFLYLGKVTNTLIPALAIPASILGTFIIMLLLGYSIDILSLLAITLAIGFLVDDAIVVLENIARFAEKGSSPFEAALMGSKQISITILSMTVCLCTVFIPLLFMAGIVGKMLHEFAVTIVTAVFISGIISLTLTPMLCSRFVKGHTGHHSKVEKFSIWFNEKILDVYHPSLRWTLEHKGIILLTGIMCLLGSLFLLIQIPKDFLPADDIGMIQAFAELPDGASPFATIDLTKQIEAIAIKNPYVERVVSLGAIQQDNQAIFYFRLVDIKKRPPASVVVGTLYEAFKEIVGPRIFLKPLPLINLQVGAQVAKADYQYTLQGLDTKALYPAAVELEDRMKGLKELSTVASDMDISQPQLTVNIQRDKASLYGITALQIENVLSLAFGDINLSPINEPDNQYYVIMETLPKFYKDPSKLSQLWLTSISGKLVPFTEVVELKEEVGPLSINHINGLPAATISFNVAKNVPLQSAIDAIESLAKEILPPTVFGTVQGSANIFKQSFASLNFLLMVTIFIIYIVLGILYENFFHPVTVMSTLPPAAFGGLLTLLIFQWSLSLYAFVGIILLLGIVLKNGIILVDFANEGVEKENKTPSDAIYAACSTRLRPILMTTLSALMGALPIAFGIGGMIAQSRRPLGAVIVGGLLFSQVLTLYLTPVIYLYVEQIRSKLHSPAKVR